MFCQVFPLKMYFLYNKIISHLVFVIIMGFLGGAIDNMVLQRESPAR